MCLPVPPKLSPVATAALAFWGLMGSAWAQVLPAAASASAPTTAPEVQRVEVQGERLNDLAERRQSTASKTVVGREEIERFSDSSVGELLKRLPGVSVQGQPGRGGQIRMRGLGSGYTQVLLDGERVQGGLSLDTMDPEQIERIEIIRAPTAETGARAIGGTINIVTREGFVKRLNDLKLSVGGERDHLQPRLAWTRDDKWLGLDYNLSLSLAHTPDSDASQIHTTLVDADPALREDRTEYLNAKDWRNSVHLTGRLQGKGEAGSSWMLMPLFISTRGQADKRSVFAPPLAGELPYDRSQTHSDWLFEMQRLNGQWRQRLGEGRLEIKAGVGQARVSSLSQRTEFGQMLDGGQDLYRDQTGSREVSGHVHAKHALLLENDHNLVSGVELEQARRRETRDYRLDGSVLALESPDDALRASSQRLAAFAQDEWVVSPQWSAHAGLRWEGIVTEGSGADAPRNRSSVWTPLLHAVWKPEPRSRDQLRMSLTRSYRSPSLAQLMGATTLAKGDNTRTNPDRSGNPALQPELATGVDVSYERYLSGGGLLSAGVFSRQIDQLIRSVTQVQTQADGSQRYVAAPRNIGRASTQGVELEAKLRLSEWWDGAPPTELRANLSLYRSRVAGVDGPDNRLDQQPDGTLGLSLDHRLQALPLSVGGFWGYTPRYTTRLAKDQWLVRDARHAVDAYLLWTQRADLRWRLSLSNLAAHTSQTRSVVGPETAVTDTASAVQWRLQVEMKL